MKANEEITKEKAQIKGTKAFLKPLWIGRSDKNKRKREN
jgi:hypothetical protein